MSHMRNLLLSAFHMGFGASQGREGADGTRQSGQPSSDRDKSRFWILEGPPGLTEMKKVRGL